MCIFSNFGINPHNMQVEKIPFLICWTVNDIIISNWPFLCHDINSVHLKVLNGSEKIFEITKFVIWDSGVIYGRGR